MLQEADIAQCDSASEVTELTFLVPQAQVEMLERKAWRHGLTLGQLLRRMISSHPVCLCPEGEYEVAQVSNR